MQLSEAATSGVIRDDFTDVNGTPLLSHVPDGGGVPFSWLGTVWNGGEEEAVIQGNAVGATRGGNWVYMTSVETGDRVDLEFEVFREVTNGQDVGFFLRTAEGDFQDGISVFWGISPASNFVELIEPRVVVHMPAPISQGLHTLRAEIIGSQLDVYADGARIMSQAVTVPSARRTAIGLFRTADPDVRVTSFAATGEEVRIRPLTGSMQVSPLQTEGSSTLDLEVGVYDPQGEPVPNRTVKLELTAKELAAGHEHENEGDKPEGTLSDPDGEVETGSLGVVRVRYTAPEPSGPVAIRGTSDGAKEALDTIRVMVANLVELPASPTYRFVGSAGDHPGRFYVTQATSTALQTLAARFEAVYNKTLGYNDAGLEQGGVFDLRNNWIGKAVVSPHAEHRIGRNLDMRIIDREPKELNFVRARWRDISTRNVRDAIKEETNPPHFHLRY